MEQVAETYILHTVPTLRVSMCVYVCVGVGRLFLQHLAALDPLPSAIQFILGIPTPECG